MPKQLNQDRKCNAHGVARGYNCAASERELLAEALSTPNHEKKLPARIDRSWVHHLPLLFESFDGRIRAHRIGIPARPGMGTLGCLHLRQSGNRRGRRSDRLPSIRIPAHEVLARSEFSNPSSGHCANYLTRCRRLFPTRQSIYPRRSYSRLSVAPSDAETESP